MKKLNTTIQLLFCCILLINLNSCVQPTKKQTVHLTVDATNELNVSSISVRGSLAPLSWNSNFELKDENSDSIYTGTLVFDIPYDYVNIKFVKNENEFELQDQPNRQINFDQSLITYYKAIFDQSN